MKRFLLPLLLICSVTAVAQNNSILVSTAGIGELKPGLKKAELEILLNRKFILNNLAIGRNQVGRDTVQLVYNGIEAQVIFQKEFFGNNNFHFVVMEVMTSNAGIKTMSGIAIGDDAQKIITTHNESMLEILPAYKNKVKIENKSVLRLQNKNTNNVILFHLVDNKVVGFSVVANGC
ncbi:MAG: hypothetical protein V4676_06205 [Bacteroidota bacterium]